MLLLASCTVVPVFAADFTLSHKNSSAQINITNASAGVVNWTIDGVNSLNYQGFFYRVGNNPEALVQSISSSPTVSFVQVPNVLSKLDVTYANATLSVQTLFQLTGSTVGSGKGGLSETITVKNLSGAPLNFHLFQYSDFDLSGVSGGQTAQFGFDSLLQPYMVTQTDGTRTLTETVNANTAPIGRFQADTAFATLTSLNDGSPTTLGNSPFAAGNVTFAYQWDVILDPNGTLTISKLMNIVPEPAVGSMLLAMTGLWAWRHSRKRNAGSRQL